MERPFSFQGQLIQSTDPHPSLARSMARAEGVSLSRFVAHHQCTGQGRTGRWMGHNKTRSIDSSSPGKGASSSPFKRGTSTIFHSEDDVLVYEDFIRRSRQLAMTSPHGHDEGGAATNARPAGTLATPPKSTDQATDQQTTMNGNQPQQTVNFEPEPFESGISSHVPTDIEAPERPETGKSSASIVGGTFNDLLTMDSGEEGGDALSLREHMIVFLDDPSSSPSVGVHDL